MGVPTPTGTVSDANDTQGGGAVALKLVPQAVLPTPTMADRALRELKQLAKVTSDRIVRVLDQGKLSDGRIYVATEKTEGTSLEEIVGREGPMPIERARAIVLSVGEALTEAQKVGVIHRDVAPRNVLVGPGDHVKVADFGLAEPVAGSEKVFGAPAFLSPEQAEGKPVDQRSNIYSLGAMYYFALTGAPPFSGDANSLLQQQLNAAPPSPSSKRPELGADIDRVILKALEKNGGRRHLTLRQLLTEISAAQAGVVRASDSGPINLNPVVTAKPQARAGAGAQTVMGMAAAPVTSPVASMGPSGKPAAEPAAPVGQGASRSQPQAATMMMDAVAQPPASVPAAAPAAAPVPVAAQPQAQPAQPHKAPPQAATVMAEAPVLPAAAAPQANAAAPAQPHKAPPQAATVMAEAPRAAAAAAPGTQRPGNETGRKKGFRETAWFKRGELEEELARAEAAAGDNPLKSGLTGKHKPLDDDQIEMSQKDAQRLSLKTGATQAMPVLKGGGTSLPGERMDEAEMLAEISSSKRTIFIIGAVAVAIVIALIIFFATRSGGGTPKAEAPMPAKPAPVAASPPAAPPPAAVASAVPPAPSAPPSTPSPTTKTPPPAHVGVGGSAAPGAELAAAVEKVESSGDKREVKRLERVVLLDQKRARLRKDRATEAADRQLLVRLNRVGKKKK
jgi:serine/threonine-protein kinase